MQIMQRVPAAVLWMYASDVAARQNLRNAMGLHGVSPKRLFFMSKVPKVRARAECVCVC
jgi:predicted O-linked N-acetylglucosamine transferase (SPINDLY family)